MLGRQAVGAHERELLEVLQAGRVDDDAVLAPAQAPVAQAGRGQLGGLGEEVGLEEDPVEGDPEPRERLALAGDDPRARLVPELERLAFAARARV